MKLLRLTCNFVPNKMFQLQPSLYFIVNSTWNLKKMSMKSNNLHVALDDNQLHHLFRVSGFKEALLGVTILPSGRHACFPMMLLLEQSDSGWMTHTDIQDNKQILSLLWVNWVIYLYHVLLFPDFFSFNRSNLRSDVPLILVQSLFSLSPLRFWAFMPVYEDFEPFDTL